MLCNYFKEEEKHFELPNLSQINLLCERTDKKRKSGIKTLGLIAACLALFISVSFAIYAYTDFGGEITSMNEESQANKNALPDWYTPREFTVEQITISKADSPVLSTGISFMPTAFIGSANLARTASEEKKQGELPYWVARTEILNERFILLLHDWHDFSEREYYYPVYDVKKDCIRDIIREVYERNKDFIDKRNTAERDIGDIIYLNELGTSTEWGLFDIWDESGEAPVIERFMINVESGEMRKLPRYADILAISDDYRYIVWCYADENGEFTASVLDTETMSERVTDIQKRSKTVFSDDGRYIVFYKPPKTSDGGWSTLKAEWYLYELESGKTVEGKGRILRFTEDGDAVIAEDGNGAHIYLTADMSEVTEDYALREYEKYTVKSDVNGIYRVPIFDGETETVLQSEIECSAEWNGFKYYYLKNEQAIAIYHEQSNEIFYYDISDKSIDKVKYNEISIYITDNGKKCNVLTFYDDFFDKYEIYEGTVAPEAHTIKLPEDNEEISYGDGFVLYESPEGHSFTVISAFRQGDTITFTTKETDYDMDVGIVFISGGEMFVGINQSIYEDVPRNIWVTTVFDRNDNGNAHTYDMYMRDFKQMLGEGFDESIDYYTILSYHVMTEQGEEIYG